MPQEGGPDEILLNNPHSSSEFCLEVHWSWNLDPDQLQHCRSHFPEAQARRFHFHSGGWRSTRPWIGRDLKVSYYVLHNIISNSLTKSYNQNCYDSLCLLPFHWQLCEVDNGPHSTFLWNHDPLDSFELCKMSKTFSLNTALFFGFKVCISHSVS